MLNTDALQNSSGFSSVDPSGFDNEEGRTRHGVGQPKRSGKPRGLYQKTEEKNKRLAKEKKRQRFAPGFLSVLFGEKYRRYRVEYTLSIREVITEGETDLAVLLYQGSVTVSTNSTFTKIDRSKSQEELMSVLDHAGFTEQVESFRQHVLDRQDYVEEGGHPDSKMESLKAAAHFLVKYNPPYSDIEADFDGNVELEWMLSPEVVGPDIDQEFWDDGSGYMAIRFVSSSAIEFAMLSGPKAACKERLKVSGTFSHSKMNTIIKMFQDRVVLYD